MSDTLTVGLVLILLFGSIALYLYTRIQQSEQKISLLESILLDIKMSGEVKGYSEPPAHETVEASVLPTLPTTPVMPVVTEYAPFTVDDEGDDNDEEENTSEQKSISSGGVDNGELDHGIEEVSYSSVIDSALKEMDDISALPSASKVSANYESMTLQELKQVAKDKGISGVSTMKKNQILEALKTASRAEPGSFGGNDITSFIDSSAPIDSSMMIDA